MIKRERNSLGSRRLGSESQRLPRTSLCLSLFVIFWYCGGGFILTTFLSFILVSVIFLAVFVVLGMMMIWSYIKVLFTPPGYAKVSLVPAVCRVLCSLSIRRFVYAVYHDVPPPSPPSPSPITCRMYVPRMRFPFHFTAHLKQPTSVDQELVSRENTTPYRDLPPSPLPPLQMPRPPAPALPPQISQDSSTRSIPPSSSSLTSPSHLSSRPPWPGQQSRMSSTLHSHSYSGNHSHQPRSARPSTESTGHTDTYTSRLWTGSALQMVNYRQADQSFLTGRSLRTQTT
ncbi:hypothetical protein BJV77DRAFT_1158662 [Russula vinacea]|nr:hypothetical protein BJV77DRAFT_1158662 [Russula vinacea]